jgi:hypothetical protein
MTAKDFKLDMTFMYVFHDAIRRDLERIARFTARGSSPRRHHHHQHGHLESTRAIGALEPNNEHSPPPLMATSYSALVNRARPTAYGCAAVIPPWCENFPHTSTR